MNDLILVKILLCVNNADGLIGRSGLYKLLQGENSKKFMRYGLDHIDEFGALSHISKSEILNHTDYLIERGCLQIGTLLFPMIQITDTGKKRLDRMLNNATVRTEAPQIEIENPKIELDDLHVCNETDFWKLFIMDLDKARSSVVIMSAFVSEYRVNMLIPCLEGLTSRGIGVKAYIRESKKEIELEAIEKLKSAGVEVVFKNRIHQKVAIIDNSIAWSGSLNILQHINSNELMIRYNDSEHVKKLLAVVWV